MTTTDRLTFLSNEADALAGVRSNANGDLVIEGWAARWTEDREREAFAPGAFTAGVKAFLAGSAALAYHHDHKLILGRVLHLEERDGGLWMRAKVNGGIRNHPILGAIYRQIRDGDLRTLSVGGFFKRAIVAGARRIVGCDFTEISVTGVPVGHGTSFAVVAGKALASPMDAAGGIELEALEAAVADIGYYAATVRLYDALDRLSAAL